MLFSIWDTTVGLDIGSSILIDEINLKFHFSVPTENWLGDFQALSWKFIIFRPYFIWKRKIFKSNGFFLKFAKN